MACYVARARTSRRRRTTALVRNRYSWFIQICIPVYDQQKSTKGNHDRIRIIENGF